MIHHLNFATDPYRNFNHFTWHMANSGYGPVTQQDVRFVDSLASETSGYKKAIDLFRGGYKKRIIFDELPAYMLGGLAVSPDTSKGLLDYLGILNQRGSVLLDSMVSPMKARIPGHY